jgi:hypothetical protein
MSEGVRSGEAQRDPGGAAEASAGPGDGPLAIPLLDDLPDLLGLVPAVPPLPGDRGASANADRPRGRRPRGSGYRTRPFSVRLTREERAIVFRAALRQQPGTPVSCWAHDVLVAVARKLAEAGDD